MKIKTHIFVLKINDKDIECFYFQEQNYSVAFQINSLPIVDVLPM